MLYLSTQLSNLPVLSLQLVGRIGTVTEPIINPNNLHIDAFYCQSSGSKSNLVLLDIHIRELSFKGMVIDNQQALSEPKDLVRLQPILDIGFQLLGKQVVSGKKKMGKVTEYAFDNQSLFIQKIYVQPSIWQGINQHRLIYDRNSIVEVTDTQIVVSGPEETVNQTQDVKVPNVQPGYSSANTSLIKE